MTKICMVMLRHAALDDRIYYKEAMTLKDAGYEVHLITRLQNESFTDMAGNPMAKPNAKGIWEHQGFTFHGIQQHRGIYGKYLEYKSIVKTGLSIKAAIYHCHEPDIAITAALKIKSTLIPSPKLIYDIHEYGDGSWADTIKAGIKNIILRLFSVGKNKALNGSDFVITANSIVRGDMLRRNRFKKIEVIENSPVLSIFKEGEVKKKNKDSIILCHDGALGFNRGLKQLVLLLDNSEIKVKLKIVGELFGPEKKWLNDKLKTSSNLKSRIHITGWLPYHKVGEAISECDIGLIVFQPTVNNMLAGPPNKLYNYMRYGLPVISVDLPETRQIISKYRCGIIVKDWRMDHMLKAIQNLISDDELSRKMGQSGSKAILEELAWEYQGEKLLRIYDELLSQNNFVQF